MRVVEMSNAVDRTDPLGLGDVNLQVPGDNANNFTL